MHHDPRTLRTALIARRVRYVRRNENLISRPNGDAVPSSLRSRRRIRRREGRRSFRCLDDSGPSPALRQASAGRSCRRASRLPFLEKPPLHHVRSATARHRSRARITRARREIFHSDSLAIEKRVRAIATLACRRSGGVAARVPRRRGKRQAGPSLRAGPRGVGHTGSGSAASRDGFGEGQCSEGES